MTQTAERLEGAHNLHLATNVAERCYKPRNEYVLVKVKNNATTAGGLLLPKSRKKSFPLDEGEIVAVGPGDVYTSGAQAGERIPLDLEVGDTVIYPNQDSDDDRVPSPPAVVHNGVPCIILPESAIICTID